MGKHLNEKVESTAYETLTAGMTPPGKVASGILAKLTAAADYVRGTALAKSAVNGKLYLLGTAATEGDTLTPDCILCDDTPIDTVADINAAVYVAGCFNINAVTVAEGYTLTESDRDKLRERNLYLTQVLD